MLLFPLAPIFIFFNYFDDFEWYDLVNTNRLTTYFFEHKCCTADLFFTCDGPMFVHYLDNLSSVNSATRNRILLHFIQFISIWNCVKILRLESTNKYVIEILYSDDKH